MLSYMDMDAVKMTSYNEHDADDIGALLEALSQRFVDKPPRKDIYKEIVASPYHELFVVRDDTHIVAMAAVSLTIGPGDGHKAYLDDFVVLPDYRGNGLAKKLWGAVIDWCREKEVIQLFFTSRPDERRVTARAFYEHQGAKIKDTDFFIVDPR